MKFETIFRVLLLLLGGWLCILAISEWYDAYRLSSAGITAHAMVVRKDVEHGRYTDYELTYHFQPAHQEAEVTIREQVDQATFDRAAIGTPLTIRYVADHPTTAEIVGNAQSGVLWLTVMGPLFVWVSLNDLRSARKKQRRKWRSSGRPQVSYESIAYFERQQRK